MQREDNYDPAFQFCYQMNAIKVAIKTTAALASMEADKEKRESASPRYGVTGVVAVGNAVALAAGIETATELCNAATLVDGKDAEIGGNDAVGSKGGTAALGTVSTTRPTRALFTAEVVWHRLPACQTF